MKTRLFKSILIISLFSFYLPAVAEDIDLFVGASATATDLPNVMIIIDNAANFSSSASIINSTCIIEGATNTLSGTAGGVEQCALYNVFSSVDATTPTFNLGVMVYNANNIRDINNANCGGSNGGCLAQPLVTFNATNKANFLAWVKSWKTTGGAGSGYIKANGEATGAAMQETWAYLAGRTGLSGRSYLSIKPSGSCLKNYVVFVGNSYTSAGTPGDATGDSGPKNALLGTNSTANMNASPVATTSQQTVILDKNITSCGAFTFPSSAHENKGYYADEWARYMYGQGITTYTIGVLGSSCQAEYAALLTSMAAYGVGTYYPTTDYSGLVAAFKQILSEVQSVNSVFASVSLPVSVNTQGTFLNQVYIGMFRPDKDGKPRWFGNLKQYKLGYSSNVLQLLDADNAKAISASGSGFIAECARSFWTPTSINDYWRYNTKENCVGQAASSDYPDGNIVEKGAQAYTLRNSATARNIKTCAPYPSACTSIDFNTSNVTPSSLGLLLLDTAQRDRLVRWGIGYDVKNELNNATFDLTTSPTTTTDIRPSVHGDVVHSRPVAINYGTDTAPQVVVFYGGNDGVMRAVNGNRDLKLDGTASLSIGGKAPGNEIWSFMPPEFYTKIQRLYDNSPGISFPGQSAAGTQAKDYGFDGPMTADKFNGTTSLFSTMRRGGRALYAFDVSSLSTTPNPTVKWKIGCSDLDIIPDFSCTFGFTELGQTWSTPKVIKSAGYVNSDTVPLQKPMLLMGGGYDKCQDADPGTCTYPGNKGNKIYVIDANTGVLLKAFTTDSSVVADITVVPDASGYMKFAYAADLGGNIYLISGADANTSIGNTLPANWTMTKIASLGGTATASDKRKFMFAPDVLDDNGKYILLIGSGDREKPLASYTAAAAVQNRFYMIQDKPSDANWLTSEAAACGANVICNASLFAITSSATPTPVQLQDKKGWYLALTTSEQVVTSAITVFGTVTFSTFQPTPPAANACTSLGTATVYNLDYTNAATKVGTVRGQHIVGDGLPPSPVAGMVTLDDGTTVPFIIGSNPASPLQGGDPISPTSTIRPRSRAYWNITK